jgi:hypothetical protein
LKNRLSQLTPDPFGLAGRQLHRSGLFRRWDRQFNRRRRGNNGVGDNGVGSQLRLRFPIMENRLPQLTPDPLVLDPFALRLGRRRLFFGRTWQCPGNHPALRFNHRLGRWWWRFYLLRKPGLQQRGNRLVNCRFGTRNSERRTRPRLGRSLALPAGLDFPAKLARPASRHLH